ncbi:MAG: hypothetical protein Q4F99_07115, partial [bacterium]|nr:hypothetical protein [bacterium]
MKKLFYLASIAALAFSSCSKDDTTGAVVNTKSGGFTISASVVSDDATTRNYLGEVDGELAPLWSKTDVIAAFSDGTASEGVFHQNVPFAIDPFDAGQEDADFLNQENGLALLGGKNLLFYYPYNAKASLPEGLWNARDPKTGVATFNADMVDFLEVKAQQGYMDGSFISNMAPSVGTLPVSAVEVEDGTAVADVHLQPVVDYLVFKAVGTRPITKLELRLWGGPQDDRDFLPIAGEGTLQSYVVDANKIGKADAGEATRYFWVPGEDVTDVITLQPGTMTDAVCHEENTYVFVIPGGILGMGPEAEVEAYIDIYDAEGNKMQAYLKGSQLDGAKVGTGATAVEYWRHISESEDGLLVDPIMNMENHVFNANPINPNTGEREIFEFNPEGDVIIRDQIDLLQYFEEYQAALEDKQSAATPAVNVSTGEIEVEGDPRLKDAYICNNHAFDFSPEALGALATEYRNAGDEPKFNKYINKYHIYGFPCVDTYSNKFRGNGTEEHPTVISNVKLASPRGLFGTITPNANISGVTFENIVAAEWQVPVKQTRAAVETETETRRGVILGFEAMHKEVFGKGVKVVNPTADAIVGIAKAGNYAAIELDGITSNLEHIFGVLEAEAGIDLSKTWAEASKVNGSIFELIAPDSRMHTVFNVDNIASSAANYAKLTSKVLLKPYGDQKVVGVASVVLGGESWWTGGQIAASQAKATDPYLVKYAEQLANGQAENAATYTYKLTCNMNLNWENLSDVEVNGDEYDDVPWVGYAYARFDNFDGDNKTVKGVVMKSADEFHADEYADSQIAPFAFKNVKN